MSSNGPRVHAHSVLAGEGVPATTKLTPELREQIEQLARRNDRTLSAEIRRAVTFYISAHPSTYGDK